MDTISFIILLLLCLVGYSGGATGRAGKVADLKPNITDLVLVLIIWAVAIYTRLAHNFNKWILIVMWIGISAALGIAVVTFRQLKRKEDSIEEGPEQLSSTSFRRLWLKWKEFSQRMGSFQSRILLSLFFFLVISPFALTVKVLGDPLMIKHKMGRSFWLSRKETSEDLEEFRRQF